jgi:hypothetical protein
MYFNKSYNVSENIFFLLMFIIQRIGSIHSGANKLSVNCFTKCHITLHLHVNLQLQITIGLYKQFLHILMVFIVTFSYIVEFTVKK